MKAVVVDPATRQILWRDYQRHETRQPEKVLELLVAIGARVPGHRRASSMRIVHHRLGLGAAARADSARKFVQEVNAVTMAVEHLHPDVARVIELGGQDAKIIIFQEDEQTGDKTRHRRR